MAACGICGTDLHILDGEFAPSLPLIPGHEFAGEVVAVGGRRHGGGGRRPGRGRPQPPLRRVPLVPARPREPVRAVGGHRRDDLGRGGRLRRRARSRTACVLADDVDIADAALIEPLSCAVRGFDVLQARLGDRVLIYGAGTMGLINLALALRVGAASVDVVDLNAERLSGAGRSVPAHHGRRRHES